MDVLKMDQRVATASDGTDVTNGNPVSNGAVVPDGDAVSGGVTITGGAIAAKGGSNSAGANSSTNGLCCDGEARGEDATAFCPTTQMPCGTDYEGDSTSSECHGGQNGDGEAASCEKYRLMDRVSGKLLEKISQAIDQLDIQVVRELRKDKEMIYDHPQRADKATKELLVERETLTTVKAPIDRNGIKLLAAALKDVKDIAMIRDPLDIREQEAKIAKLQREAEGEKDTGTLLVTFDPNTEDLST